MVGVEFQGILQWVQNKSTRLQSVQIEQLHGYRAIRLGLKHTFRREA